MNLTVAPLEAKFGIVAKELAVCEEHGEYAAIISKHREGPSGCPACADAMQRVKDEERIAAERVKIAADRLAGRLGAALIPARFRDRSFDSFIADLPKQKKALATCKGYAENFAEHFAAGRCLLLLGNVGTGKTHLATAIANHIIRTTSGTAVYRTVGGILQHIKGSFSRDSDYSEAEAFAAYTKPSLLIIDEVGATKPTEFELATLFAIINGRYEEKLPTVVISNLSAAELPDALGERCVDRLREGGGIGVGFNWESERSKVTA
ncbi:ATP-binding protein [Pseudomonas sp.]|uniref:ATP-binding protein n=1 Tax=Pseudomonas sp. TaxID=306 RepID=UPI002356E7E6|nr:ATP-binding protein [Pseudomonas sp.]